VLSKILHHHLNTAFMVFSLSLFRAALLPLCSHADTADAIEWEGRRGCKPNPKRAYLGRGKIIQWRRYPLNFRAYMLSSTATCPPKGNRCLSLTPHPLLGRAPRCWNACRQIQRRAHAAAISHMYAQLAGGYRLHRSFFLAVHLFR
jgi:hypothetical protein